MGTLHGLFASADLHHMGFAMYMNQNPSSIEERGRRQSEGVVSSCLAKARLSLGVAYTPAIIASK